MYVLYKHYNKGGTKDVPYFSALCTVVLMIYFHIFQLLILLDKVDDILPMKGDDGRTTRYFKLALFLLPVFIILYFLVRPEDLKKANYSHESVRKGGIYLVVYGVISFILLFVLAFIFLRK